MEIKAASPGDWGNNLQVGIDYFGLKSGNNEPLGFNLVVREVVGDVVVNYEVYRNLNCKDKASPRYVDSVINESSSLIRVKCKLKGWPKNTGEDVISVINNVEKIEKDENKNGQNVKNYLMFGMQPDYPGYDGYADISDWGNSSVKATAIETGMKKLERIAPEIFNLLCLPAVVKLKEVDYRNLIGKATKFCRDNRAFLIVDIQQDINYEKLADWMRNNDTLRSDHSAIYFPLMKIADPLNENRPREVAPSGTIAGVYARTDAQRGIWKAPAGTEASLVGATLCEKLTDLENGSLNPIGINVLRNFPIHGNIAWGARTLDGADQKTSEYKYVPVRRLALYIEESLYQGLKWVVFEPNDEALWAQIRFNVGAFMNVLFRQRAFQGATAREAYFVKCDKDTTTQNDIDRGIVNVLVGFKPLKPAEFVVLRMQQIAGQLAV